MDNVIKFIHKLFCICDHHWTVIKVLRVEVVSEDFLGREYPNDAKFVYVSKCDKCGKLKKFNVSTK